MKTKIQEFILGLFAIALLVTAAGCKNTAHGAGRDIENIGETIQKKTR